jgi:hypothetical protein
VFVDDGTFEGGVLDLVHRERGPDQVPGDILPSLSVAGPHPDGAVYIESGVLPRQEELDPLVYSSLGFGMGLGTQMV